MLFKLLSTSQQSSSFLLLLSATALAQASVFHSTELLSATLVPRHGMISFSCLCPLFGDEKDNGVLKRFLKDTPSFLPPGCVCVALPQEL